MSYDISMSIGGELTDAEAARRIVMAIREGEMGPEYEHLFSGTEDILDHLTAGGRKAVVLSGRGDADIADALAEACRSVGLSYNISTGYEGEDGYRFQSAWQPGMAEEATAGSTDEAFHIRVADLEKAIEAASKSGDLAPFVALRDAVKAAHAQPGRLLVAEAVKERLSALEEDEWENELAEVPPSP